MRLIFLIFTLLLFLTGCADKIEIEEEGFVIVIGLDMPADKEQDGIDVTFKLANPVAGQQGAGQNESGEEQEEAIIISIRAPDLLSARDLANTAETRNFNFYHTKAIVISEELARSQLFLPTITTIQRERQVRGQMNVLVSKERASDYLRNSKAALESSPHKYYEFMERRWERNALVPDSSLHRFFHNIEADQGLALAIYTTAEKTNTKKNGYEDEYLPGEIDKTGGTDIQIIGAAVFRDGKMVGTFNGEETRLTLMLREDIKPGQMNFTYQDPVDETKRITVQAFTEKTKVSVDVSSHIPKITAKVKMDLRLISIPSMIDYVEDLKKQTLLEKYIEKELENKALKVVKKSKLELEGDPFHWYLQARKNFFTIQAFEKYKWPEKFANADVKIKYDVTIRDFGKKLKPHNEEEIRD